MEIGRNPFYEHLNKTIAQLSEIVLTLVQPTFRLELPAAQRPLVGRADALARCLQQLRAQGAVAISGAGGIGKTALGMAVRAAWPSDAVFWLTFRPKVNDSLSSVIFAFAHFLHNITQGKSLLWQQMIADKGSLQTESIWLGLLRSDLQQIEPLKPLVCLDDVDFLRSAYLADMSQQQQAVLTFIESLISEKLPVLLVGQQIPLVIETHVVPDLLTYEQVDRLLRQFSDDWSRAEVQQLLDICHGNPRMLGLSAALRESGESVQEIVARFPRYSSIETLLDRLWLRLERRDRQVLAALAVYRGVVPDDIWQPQQAVIERLSVLGLLQFDQHGGLALTAIVRQLIYANLARELRDNYHLEAASVRAQRGEYTFAAFHFYSAGAFEQAVAVWYSHADLEVARGQAAVAREVFADVPLARLNAQRQAQLVSISQQAAFASG